MVIFPRKTYVTLLHCLNRICLGIGNFDRKLLQSDVAMSIVTRSEKCVRPDLLYGHHDFDCVQTVQAQIFRKRSGRLDLREHVVNCVVCAGSELTFSALTFSKVLRTSSTRASICDLSRALAAEKAARCWKRFMCSLESEAEATWREVTLRKAR